MGFVREGTTISYLEAKKLGYVDFIRTHGIQQFLSLFHRSKNRNNDSFKWGDEIEYQLVHLDSEARRVRVALTGPTVLQRLHELERRLGSSAPFHFQPEFAAFQVEATPGVPYCNGGEEECFLDLLKVEQNMRERRRAIQAQLPSGVYVVTMSCFPRLGLGDYLHPTSSNYSGFHDGIPTELVAPHARYRCLLENILQRRGDNVDIHVPVFRDVHTTQAAVEMKAVAYGTAMCCLQTTFQCPGMDDARWVYDQLAVLAPLLLALTAATPVVKGVLADTDARWMILSASSDDRTPAERAEGSAIIKSRFDTISVYTSSTGEAGSLNDLPVAVEPACYERLVGAGVDDAMARHIAHLFVRDPLIILREAVEGNAAHERKGEAMEVAGTFIDETALGEGLDHFENILSTNWHSVRLKPPSASGDCGWRVELRTMEVQLTDTENTAFAVFSALLVKALLHRRRHQQPVDWRMPLSLVDRNMQRAHAVEAVVKEKFYFYERGVDEAPQELFADQIINGRIIPLLKEYMDDMASMIDSNTREQLDKYLSLIGKRVRGELETDAMWLRRFVCSHPKYAHDSIVTEEIAYDLVAAVVKLSTEEVRPPELLGTLA